METIKKHTLCRLTDRFVEIETNQYIELNGEEVKLNIPTHGVSYMNSSKQRELLKDSDFPQNIKDAILKVWGKSPTVED